MTATPETDEPSPLVSVVVLTHERPRHLARCLRSLGAQDLDAPIEVVVADDGSGPQTARVVRDALTEGLPVRHVRHEHRGIPATRNLGVAAARTPFIAIVADDYVLAPHYLSLALAYLRDHPDAAVVRFDVLPGRETWGARLSHCYYAASLDRRLASEGITSEQAQQGVATTTLEAAGAAVFRAEVLAAVGPWDETLRRAEDTEHTARLRALDFQVHYLAAGVVEPSYRAVPVDTLRKCALTGYYRSRLPDTGGPADAGGKVRALRRALDRARRGTTSAAAFAWYLPWMLVFEAAAVAGYAVGRATAWLGARRSGT